MKTAIALPIDQITKFCQHWQIIELSLFGSILRDDFHADSDIDILVAFAPTVNWVYSIARKCRKNSKQSSANQSI
jgi:predicted nucleotidyltransferase